MVFDFDGPIVRLFAGAYLGLPSTAPLIARELLALAASYGCLLDELGECTDPLLVLLEHAKEAKRRGGEGAWGRATSEMRNLLDAWERKSAEHAEQTPGAADFIRLWHGTGRHLSIVSSNHEDAIVRCLEREALRGCFDGPVVGRPDDLTRMKPDPWPLRQAMMSEAGGPESHLMIGDSVTDCQAARAVGMPFWGYHRNPDGRRRLREAGAVEVVETMVQFVVAAQEALP
ncbi:HAD family hydrolase [Streptomyces sp. NPDC058301]|uniref:HAD family hydrolase n=1 Tax=Streptomyces sp. NPDC058301 TaxID=3346436 RepID=UPI0036EA9658